MRKSIILRVFVLVFSLYIGSLPLNAYAMADMEAQKFLPVTTNEINNWPAGPSVSAYSAILMDADTGVILYDKNSHELMFPASTTKLLTCLLAMEKENANLNDLISFSYDAVMTVPRDASNMGIDAGEKMTLEECLYGVLVVSANEVANAIAEYVDSDIDTFVERMNRRAKELGCLNTHFTNPHGYTDPDHYTTAYDLAQISREFFKNELLSKICCASSYHWYPTEYQPDDMILGSTNYFMRGTKHCDGLIGSKTGYTDESRNVLVSCAERNGMKLICVVMKEETPYQYDDTNTLFDYGFSNFENVKVSDYETKYIITDNSFFHSYKDVFGNSSEILSMDPSSSIILPKTLSFDDLDSSLLMNEKSESNKIATVTYSFQGIYLGQADILFQKKSDKEFIFNESASDVDTNNTTDKGPVFIYINYIIYGLIALVLLIFVIAIIRKVLSVYHFAERRKAISHWKERNKRK